MKPAPPNASECPEMPPEAEGDRVDQMIFALLTHPTKAEACESLGINRKTLWRWEQDPSFQRRYRDAQRRLYEHSIGQALSAQGEAIQTLRDIARNPDAQDGARVTACRTLLDIGARSITEMDLADRLDALEQLTSHLKGSNR